MELYCPKQFPLGAAFWGAAAVVLVLAGGCFGNPHFVIAALAPAVLALGLFWCRRSEFRCSLSEEGLELANPPQRIPYAAIEGLSIGGVALDPEAPRFRRGPLVVTHRSGVLEIPPPANAPVQKVYQAILAMLPATGSYRLSPAMIEHFQKEKELFGPERVHYFSRRKFGGPWRSTRRVRICALLLTACGILWCFVPLLTNARNVREYEVWPAMGAVLAVVSFVVWLVLYLSQFSHRRRPRAFDNAELIISPTGIAVRQGDLEGHLCWDEALDVRFAKAYDTFLADSRRPSVGGVHITIAGAKIHLPDIYDRPIVLIHRLIRRYWKGE